MIKEFEKISNRSFTVNYIPLAALKQQAVEAIDPLQKSFASIMIFYANGDVIDMKPVLEKIPIKLHSIKDYANAVLNKKVEPVAEVFLTNALTGFCFAISCRQISLS